MYMGRRENMEDQVSIINNLRGALSMYAVFDGHDGVATATFLKLNFGKKLKALLETQTPIDALKSCYTEMDVMLKESNISNSGSTSSTILIDEQNIYVANAGDSRAVICRTNGVERITIDHKPYNPDEHTRIRAAGGLVTDDGRISGVLAVSRSFGDLHLQPFVSPEPYVQQFQRSVDDEWLVVASDGLWDAVADSQIGDIIRTCESPREAAVKLKDMAFQGESTDNISVIAIKLRVL
eukprot:TRINITY_DN816_c0_g1_i1.p1 TRINITY_DN816_c0_g1~~TRINITY_DN816_c0_g1_i1.p1  ORF type:complete len:238 (-),score=52.43 TRINITY_DN816_c0_g1_i1:317-1030(-)